MLRKRWLIEKEDFFSWRNSIVYTHISLCYSLHCLLLAFANKRNICSGCQHSCRKSPTAGYIFTVLEPNSFITSHEQAIISVCLETSK